MSHLMRLDTVAYVRFASVYREFETLADFREIVETVWLLEKQVASLPRRGAQVGLIGPED
jgi:transcriptional regulator NrdR family protein